VLIQEDRHPLATPRASGGLWPRVSIREQKVQVAVGVNVPHRHTATHGFRKQAVASGSREAIDADPPGAVRPNGTVLEGQGSRRG